MIYLTSYLPFRFLPFLYIFSIPLLLPKPAADVGSSTALCCQLPLRKSPHLARDISSLPRWQLEFSYDKEGEIYKTVRHKHQ
jgi:hypothetical protein